MGFFKNVEGSTCLTHVELESIFNDKNVIFSSLPPVGPKNGDIFLHENESGAVLDFVADGISWKNNGTRHLPKNNPKYTVRYYRRRNGNTTLNFNKTSYTKIIGKNNNKSTKTIIIYHGKHDMSNIEKPHGNRLSNLNKAHYRTMPSLLKSISKSNKTVNETYMNLINSESVPEQYENVGKPKNAKQVENKLAISRKEKELSTCEVLSCVLLNEELGNIIKKFELLPYRNVVIINDDIINELIKIQKNSGKLFLSYDTTYDVGDYYLSALVFKNTELIEEPAFIAATLMHQKRNTNAHKLLFSTILDFFPELNAVDTIIVTDRERGIVNAIKTVLTKVRHHFCQNHFVRDIDYWMNKCFHSKDDLKGYKYYVNQLLECNSDAEFNMKLSQFRVMWSQEFVDYFQSSLENDLLKNHRGKLTESGITSFEQKLTSNMSESINAVIKRLTHSKDLKLHQSMLMIHQIHKYNLNEIRRAHKDLGKYNVKNHVTKRPEQFKYDDCVKSPEDIVRMINNDMSAFGFDSFNKIQIGVNQTKEAIAKDLIRKNQVTLVPSLNGFLVRRVNGNLAAVNLNTNSCTCSNDKNCPHIMACKIAAGTVTADNLSKHKSTVTLTQLSKKARGKKRSGKKSNLDKTELSIIEAPDSLLATSGVDLFTINEEVEEEEEIQYRSTPILKKLEKIKICA